MKYDALREINIKTKTPLLLCAASSDCGRVHGTAKKKYGNKRKPAHTQNLNSNKSTIARVEM